MSEDQRQDSGSAQRTRPMPAPAGQEGSVSSLMGLSGRQVLDRILEAPHPKVLIQEMAPGDFYWLVKRVGEGDCTALLRFASDQQRQHLLDLEIWEGSRPDETAVSHWLERLYVADPRRLARWLLAQGSALAFQHFAASLEVFVTEEEDDLYDLPPGCFSLDGVVHVRAGDPRRRELVENILRAMAGENFTACEAMLLGLKGVLPAELEEQMYRVRNLRLSEHGFLPMEEAQAVFAPLNPERLAAPGGGAARAGTVRPEEVDTVPVLPLAAAGDRGILAKVFEGAREAELQDRLRLEFAGLCNQILSAQGLSAPDWDTISDACRKAASLLNLALESLSNQDLATAAGFVEANSLVDLFRAGQTLVLKLKWEAERWLKGSWFKRAGFAVDFWGEAWGGTLAALMERLPRHQDPGDPAQGPKDFERMAELASSMGVLRKVMVLDGFLERLVDLYALPHEVPVPGEITCRQMVFNLWARLTLRMPPSFEGVPLERARELFGRLRAEGTGPPYRMEGFGQRFVEDFMAHAEGVDAETGDVLRRSLAVLWEEFREEVENVSLGDLDARYARFVTIASTETAESGQ